MKMLKTTIGLFAVMLFFTACKSEFEFGASGPTSGSNTTTPTSPNETESDVLSWRNWYLSVPIDAGGGNATSIGYQRVISDQLSAEEAEYFYENSDGSYTMWTKFTGFTTSGLSNLGDKYCRTELREYWRGNQDVFDNWLMDEGTHELETQMKVDYAGGNGRTIISQIHGKESLGIPGNPATVKIRWNDGMIQVDHYTKPDGDDPWTSRYDEKVDFGRVDNERFTFRMKIQNGKLFCALSCEAKNLNIGYREIYDYVGNGYIHENYFKAGNYYQWNDDYTKEAQVVLYSLEAKHR